MALRNVTVFLRAEVTDFNRQLASAAQATSKASADIDASGQKIQTSMGRMVRSAEVNREAWTTAGTAFTAVGAAVTALGAAALKTGIEYNTLQQTSRAALTTMLGTAEAANEQMDKLDDWARNSPFAKQVFIDAQRQMLGFGIEAQNVLPYLDAIQNAVAAMGGSNQDIAEISTILAKIASQGKITARELMQLGIHGIDAATLIGTQMDQTAGEIRESITAGSIDAMTALDALTAGMQERFGGAAENVKNTYEGAIDRVKAAWRDLASELATPLVDPDGGGLLIDWANDLADAMRQFQDLPDWLKGTVAVLGSVAGAAALATGAFMLLAPRAMDTIVALDKMGIVSAPRATKALGGFTKAIGVAAAALVLLEAGNKLNSAMQNGAASVAETTAALLELSDTTDSVNALFRDVSAGFSFGRAKEDFDGIADAMARITDPALVHRYNDFLGEVVSLGRSEGSSQRTAALEQFEAVGIALGDLVNSGHAEEAAAQFEALYGELDPTMHSREDLLALLPQYEDALTGVSNEAKLAANSTAELADAEENLAAVQEEATLSQERLTEAHKAFREEYEGWRTTMSDAFTGFMDNQGAWGTAQSEAMAAAQEQAQAANEASAEWARQQDGDVKTVTKTWEDFYDGVTVSARAYIDALQEQVDAQKEWADNVQTLSDRINESFVGMDLENARKELDELVAAGPAAAGVISTLAGATDEEMSEVVKLWGIGGEDAAKTFVDNFQMSSDPFVEPRLDLQKAQEDLDQWARQTVQIEVEIARIDNDWLLGHGLPGQLKPGAVGYAGGGLIRGPGTGTSDSIPIWASDGEHMTRAAAVNFWGGRAMESINDMDVDGLWRELGARGFRDGGSITVASASPQVVSVPVTQTYESHAPQNFNIYGADLPSIEAEAERRRRNDLGGR